MRRLRSRKSIALFCIGAVALAAFLPLAQQTVTAVLAPLWVIVPAVVVVVMRRTAVRRNERQVPLVSVLFSRPPPSLRPLA
jgi:dolichol kinase